MTPTWPISLLRSEDAKSSSLSSPSGFQAALPAHEITASIPVTRLNSAAMLAGSSMSTRGSDLRDTPMTSWRTDSARTTAEPMVPVAPMTTIFMPRRWVRGTPAARAACHAQAAPAAQRSLRS